MYKYSQSSTIVVEVVQVTATAAGASAVGWVARAVLAALVGPTRPVSGVPMAIRTVALIHAPCSCAHPLLQLVALQQLHQLAGTDPDPDSRRRAVRPSGMRLHRCEGGVVSCVIAACMQTMASAVMIFIVWRASGGQYKATAKAGCCSGASIVSSTAVRTTCCRSMACRHPVALELRLLPLQRLGGAGTAAGEGP